MDYENSDGIDDDKYVIFKQNDLHLESFPLMKEIRRQGKLCDVTLKVSSSAFFLLIVLMVIFLSCGFITIFAGGGSVILSASNRFSSNYTILPCDVYA